MVSMTGNDYHQICLSCMNNYVGLQTSDGKTHDGFIAHVDNEYVTLAIPGEMMNSEAEARQFGYYHGYFPRRRFYGRRIPLAAITGLFLLPFFL